MCFLITFGIYAVIGFTIMSLLFKFAVVKADDEAGDIIFFMLGSALWPLVAIIVLVWLTGLVIGGYIKLLQK